MKITDENIPMLLNSLTIGNYVVETTDTGGEMVGGDPLAVSTTKRGIICMLTDRSWVALQRMQKYVLNKDPYLSGQTYFNVLGPINLKVYLEAHVGWDILRVNDLRFDWDSVSEIPAILNPLSVDGYDCDDDDDDMEDDDE